jgi:hypothetical protein
MGLEDAGVLSQLLSKLCVDAGSGEFSTTNFATALRIYEQMRLPRTHEILSNSKFLGHMQQKRSVNAKYNEVKEELIQRDVFFHETLPVMFTGAKYDYKAHVEEVLENEPAFTRLKPVVEEEEETGGDVAEGE